MIFDTDIIIWVQRGNVRASNLIDEAESRSISILTYMELLQCARNKKQHNVIRDFLHACDFEVLPLSGNVGHRASVYIEEYSMSTGLRAVDALIAATAVEHDLVLATSNQKHFKDIKGLSLNILRPGK